MSTDDKYGVGAGLLALGLAALIIWLGQLTYDKDVEAALAKSASAAADSGKPSADAAASVKPSLLYRLLPHREPNRAEMTFDCIVWIFALPAGFFFFVSAVLSGATVSEPTLEGKPA